ncbi:MAG: alkaline phosphatase family protein [Actinomycetota bacterium]
MRARSLLSVCLAAGVIIAPAAGRAARAGLEGVPSFRHVVVLVLENENASKTWGASSVAHYLNSLVPQGVFVPNYYGIGHASLDNYIAMVSGQWDQPLTGSDCQTVSLWVCVQPQSVWENGRNLADQMEEKHVTWKGYMDGMPSPCFHGPYSPSSLAPDPYQGDTQTPPANDYADRHNPFIYFDDIIGNDARCRAHIRPYTELASDIAHDRVPAFSFITPDTCHDGHDAPCSNGASGGLISADAWLSQNVPALLAYLWRHDGLLVITTDENGFNDTELPPGCCSGGPLGLLPGFGGRVGLLALSPKIHGGRTVTTSYDHMSLLRTVEDAFGIGEHLNDAARAAAMSDVLR